MISVELDNATVVFTSRRGGNSRGPYASLNLGLFAEDDEAVVRENLELVREQVGVDSLALLHQVHGGVVVDADAALGDELPEGDAQFTETARKGLLITGADCPPVAIAGPDKLAMLHCGWRPVAAGIIEHAVEQVGDGPLQAAIGPGISARNYEVGPEVVAALGEDGEMASDGRQLDLQAVIRARLERAGVEVVGAVDDCTFADAENYFSYRRDGAPTGRQAGIAWRN